MTQATADREATRAEAADCRNMLRGGSRSFFAASLLMPGSIGEPAAALYGFCRVADDAIDEGRDKAAALRELRGRLDAIYADRPHAGSADRAFARVVHEHGIPRALPEALLEGFEWDAQERRYEDLSGLCDYAARVAGTVGAMMTVVMGGRDPHVLARACDLGVAMQLTNIARDVGEDARAGRIYLPLAWLREAGVDADALVREPAFTDRLGTVIKRLLAAADELYGRAATGIAHLPAACRPGIQAARILYADIGREVARNGHDSVSSRAVVGRARKLVLVTRALIAAAAPARDVSLPPLAETRFLVDAVAASPPVDRATDAEPWPEDTGGLVWMLGLFERLERRDRLQLEPAGADETA